MGDPISYQKILGRTLGNVLQSDLPSNKEATRAVKDLIRIGRR